MEDHVPRKGAVILTGDGSFLPLALICQNFSKASLVNTGGNFGNVKTRYLSYEYACDCNYANCGYIDVYALGKNIGLYDWKLYVNHSGSWVLRQESVISQCDWPERQWEGSASGDASRPPTNAASSCLAHQANRRQPAAPKTPLQAIIPAFGQRLIARCSL
jgi:hypothetical protein